MERVLTMVTAGYGADGILSDPNADEEEYYNKFDEALNNSKIMR